MPDTTASDLRITQRAPSWPTAARFVFVRLFRRTAKSCSTISAASAPNPPTSASWDPRKALTDADLDRFTVLDYVRNFGLAATRLNGRMTSASSVSDGTPRSAEIIPDSAEVAFAVDDEYQGRGVGTLLLEHLGRIARANGISRLEADVLVSQHRACWRCSRAADL